MQLSNIVAAVETVKAIKSSADGGVGVIASLSKEAGVQGAVSASELAVAVEKQAAKLGAERFKQPTETKLCQLKSGPAAALMSLPM